MTLSTPLKNAMKTNDIKDVSTLFSLTEEEILSMKGFGPKLIEEIRGLNLPEPIAEEIEPAQPKQSGVRVELESRRAEANDSLGERVLELENDVTPILEGIKSHTMVARQAMDQTPIPLQTLANEQIELSILLQRMAERIAVAGYLHREAENNLEKTRETYKVIFVEEGDAAGVADSKKKLEAQEEFEITNHSKMILDNINLTRKSTDKTIDTLRSKLSFEKSAEMR